MRPKPDAVGNGDDHESASSAASFSVAGSSLVYLAAPFSQTALPPVEIRLTDRNRDVERLKLPAARYSTPRVSPDGTHLALGVQEGNLARIPVYELSGASALRDISLWTYSLPGTVMARFGNVHSLFLPAHDVFIMDVGSRLAHPIRHQAYRKVVGLFLPDDTAAAPPPVAQIRVIVNWMEELKARR